MWTIILKEKIVNTDIQYHIYNNNHHLMRYEIPNKYLHYFTITDHIYCLQIYLTEVKSDLGPNGNPICNSSHPTCGTVRLDTS